MNYYTMKTLTTNGEWFPFMLSDLPVLVDENTFALLGKPNSPRLRCDSIRRGDIESGLYEGDVISMYDDKWLICYERGFYAINEEYVVRYLNNLGPYTVLGDCTSHHMDVSISFRSNHLFKVGDVIFRLPDIVGAFEGKLLLRSVKGPVDTSGIQQECCATYNGNRVYLGDMLDGCELQLAGGRLVRNTPDGPIDITTGRNINGCD